MAQSQTSINHDLSSGVGMLESGITLNYRTDRVLRPSPGVPMSLKDLPFLPLGAAFGVSGNTMRHVIYDKTSQSYFGYDMAVAATPGAKGFQVVFGPLTVSSMMDALKAIAGDLPLNPAPPPKYPPPQTVYSGDIIELDMMSSADGRARVVDYIQLYAPAKAEPRGLAATAEPRDFSIDDGPVDFAFRAPAVLINGETLPNTVEMAHYGGATLAFYFPGQGRYVLSLAPHDGFVKSGTVRDNIIAFQSDGRQYEIQFESPIAGAGKGLESLCTPRSRLSTPERQGRRLRAWRHRPAGELAAEAGYNRPHVSLRRPALLAAVQTSPGSVADVLQTMQTIGATCIDGDGLKWFNWLYLQVTQAVEARVASGEFGGSEWLARLDVQFARLYFGALESAFSGDSAAGCWEALFQRRNRTPIARIQFALAGINAHINHDLPLAIVATCQATSTVPQHSSANYADYTALNSTLDGIIESAKRTLHVRLLGDALPPVSHLEDTIAAWSVSAAREAAWNNAELLWYLRTEPALTAAFMDTLDGLTTVAGKALLAPAP